MSIIVTNKIQLQKTIKEVQPLLNIQTIHQSWRQTSTEHTQKYSQYNQVSFLNYNTILF